MTESVLLIDDDAAVLKSVGALLRKSGYTVAGATTGSAGIEAFREAGADVVVLDLRLPDMSGLDVLKQLKQYGASVILLTGYGDISTAVEALRLGAEDFLTKPVDLPHLRAALSRTLSAAKLQREVDRLRTELHARVTLDGLGVSGLMKDIAREIEQLSDADESMILLTGESGVGKGWVARLIHARSQRAGKPFITVTCGDLSIDPTQDELFGVSERATGRAPPARRGLFEMAHGGVLFLDEVGDLPGDIQVKLLGVLEMRSLRGNDRVQVALPDVRLIAATNQDLDALAAAGRFRRDLLYRIGAAVIDLPPLRDRAREDCLDLVHRLTTELGQELPRAPTTIHEDAMQRLLEHSWPGNVREMRNVLEWAMIMARGSSALRVEHLPQEIRKGRSSGARRFHKQTLDDIARHHVERVLAHHGGNRTRAAKDLGISRATLIQKIKRYGLES